MEKMYMHHTSDVNAILLEKDDISHLAGDKEARVLM